MNDEMALVVLPHEPVEVTSLDGVPADVLAVCESDWRASLQSVREALYRIRERLAPLGRFKEWCEAHQLNYESIKRGLSYMDTGRPKEPNSFGRSLPTAPLLSPEAEASVAEAMAVAAYRLRTNLASLPTEQQSVAVRHIIEHPQLEPLHTVQALRAEATNASYRERMAIPPPTGQYRCVVLDPPWPMAKILTNKNPAQDASLDYPTLPLEDIRSLDLPTFAVPEGCHLYLWTTHHFLPLAFQMVEDWGFHYECLLTWVKPSGFSPFSWMYNTEHCLFAHRGNLPLLQKGRKVSIVAPKTAHSVKPEAFYDLVRECSPGPRLEMFSRSARDGFTGWGDEYVTDTGE